MRKDNVSKVTRCLQNSLGIIMCKFRAVQSKIEGMATSVRVFFEHSSYVVTVKWYNKIIISSKQNMERK